MVHCPFWRAPVYLDRYFQALERGGGGPAVLRLELPLEEFGIPGGAVIGRDVSVSLVPMTLRRTMGHFSEDEQHFEHITAVMWEPANGGPFPVFRGFLCVQSCDDYGSCKLVLEGDYRPPFGVAGRVFDAVVGRRIARATARDLLHKLERVMLDAHRDAVDGRINSTTT